MCVFPIEAFSFDLPSTLSSHFSRSLLAFPQRLPLTLSRHQRETRKTQSETEESVTQRSTSEPHRSSMDFIASVDPTIALRMGRLVNGIALQERTTAVPTRESTNEKEGVSQLSVLISLPPPSSSRFPHYHERRGSSDLTVRTDS